jgi:hypothetical protein
MRLAIHADNAVIDMTAMRSPQAVWAGAAATKNSPDPDPLQLNLIGFWILS